MARALTKRKKDGSLYKRPPEIEAAIDLALKWKLERQLISARIRSRDDQDFMTIECLLHIIREAQRNDDRRAVNTLLPELLRRCEALLFVKIQRSEFANADDLCGDVLQNFCELLAKDGAESDSDLLDFYECRFNLAFRGIRVARIREEVAFTSETVPMPEPVDDAEGSLSADDVLARLSEAARVPAMQDENLYMADLRDAIYALPEDECKAVVLCRHLGYNIESENPDEQTAATKCGVTGRTIQNRLARAAKKLVRFKEDK